MADYDDAVRHYRTAADLFVTEVQRPHHLKGGKARKSTKKQQQQQLAKNNQNQQPQAPGDEDEDFGAPSAAAASGASPASTQEPPSSSSSSSSSSSDKSRTHAQHQHHYQHHHHHHHQPPQLRVRERVHALLMVGHLQVDMGRLDDAAASYRELLLVTPATPNGVSHANSNPQTATTAAAESGSIPPVMSAVQHMAHVQEHYYVSLLIL